MSIKRGVGALIVSLTLAVWSLAVVPATAQSSLSLVVSNILTEGDAPVYGSVSLSVPVTTNVQVELSSSDTTEMMVYQGCSEDATISGECLWLSMNSER